MKILHINTETTWRGGEQQVLYLAKGLKDRGHESVIICQPNSPLSERAKTEGLYVDEVRMRSEFDLLAAWRIGKLLRQEDYDILHVHTSHAHSIGLLARFFGKVKVMGVSRRVDFPIRSRFKYNSSDVHYIAVSEAVKRVLIEGGVSAQKIEIVRSCIDLERFDKAEIRDVRTGWGIGKEAVVIGNIAHMADHKGQIYLISAADIVKRRWPNVRFVIVGDGELRGELEAEARKLSLDGVMIFAGFRKDIPSILASFDIFAFPSHLEGLGTSLLDAMAMKKPIVSTTAGGIPEIVEDCVNGILVPPKDPEALATAIIRLVEDDALRFRYGNAGRRIVEERFTVDRMAEKTEAVYKKLLSIP